MAALLCLPRNEEPLLLNLPARLGDRWRTQSRTRRELIACATALLFGLLVLPWIVWLAGQAFLGPYANGGAWHFMSDFFSSLAQGALIFWAVVLGPLLFLILIRLLRHGLQATTHRGQ